MSKILTTQLTGLLQRINQNEEETIEDAARLLAQAGIGEGNVYFACFGEMSAIAINALTGAAPFTKLKRWSSEVELTSADRVCIFTRSGNDTDAVALAQKLNDEFIPFAAIASERESIENELSQLAYVYISLHVRGGLIPHPTNLGERIVFPHLITALYVYEAIKMSYDEMVDEETFDENDELIPPSPFA